ncbi:GNAT family N-acetyltransferase [Flavobacterium sp.]|uniref:GNAT family N-acetyltransferase n=1 Tax=Flavobacterium sp. TaxID=239 RepID=UPI00391920F4
MILIYKLNREAIPLKEETSMTLAEWKPSVFSWYPKGYGAKYFLYSLFSFLGIFKNKNYSAFFAYKENELVGSLLVVPKYFKWPFMHKDDVQLTYVKIYKEYRGKGYGKQMITNVLFMLQHQNRDNAVWYVTDDSNQASKSTAEGVGFQLNSYGVKSNFLGLSLFKILKSSSL